MHRMPHHLRHFALVLFAGFTYLGSGSQANAALLNLPDTPLFIDGSKSALVQLIVERDNKLFYEAYPTYEDINNDGVLDIRYKPEEIDYYGYFESNFCYTHNGSYFQPTSFGIDKKCTAQSQSWSGDFLNYVTMTRMDIMLRSLYGGKRIVDTDSKTVIRRAFVPWENHTWGIEYTSESEEGFKISEYSSLSEPQNGNRHLIATNNFIGKGDVPYLRIRENVAERIWDWVDKERTQGDGIADQNIELDVEVCAVGFLEDVCKQYPNGNHKPTGLLHEYGENNSMYFSLLTGSYENNLQGGVLRKTMSSFTDEVDPSTGIFTSTEGIVSTLDAIQIPNDFSNSTVQNDCGWLDKRTFVNGECRAWGNPIAEMMYEGMRYLSGAKQPTPSFHTDAGLDKSLGLNAATWDDPYSTSQPYAQCSGAYQLVISDPSPSFDGDQLPGSHFSGFNESSLGSLHVGNIADFISGEESEIPGMKYIGEADGVADGSPSPKLVNTFRTIRGQAPEAPHRQGSYYAPSVSYFGHQNDIHPAANGKQTVSNFTLALGSPLPTIDIDVNGQEVTFAPFAKTVGGYAGCSLSQADIDNFSPTNAIVGFVVEDIAPNSGSFRVSFEDMEQGADNDMDALARYEYEVVGNEVVFSITSLAASGCYIQHMGYTVSGTSMDGTYLVVRDADTEAHRDVDFFLDVPPGEIAGAATWEDNIELPLISALTFTPTSTPAAQPLNSPLWYAAKWGGFQDINGNGLPELLEWDSNNDGDPDNFFRVSDPSLMVETLGNVFSAISEQSATATAVSVSGASTRADSYIYESSFHAGQWYGELTSRAIDSSGKLANNTEWNVNTQLSQSIANDSRTILTYKPSTKTGIAFQWPTNANAPTASELDIEQIEALSNDPITNIIDNRGSERIQHLRGDTIADFRTREKPLGDIINSTAQLVGPPTYYYSDNWGAGEPETANPYSSFGSTYANRDRVVYVGANDGMLHAFNAGKNVNGKWTAGDGSELFAYVPSAVYEDLSELTSEAYSHKFYVDASPTIGDALIGGNWRTILVGGLGRGGQGIYALDVTDVGSVSETNADATVLWEFSDRDDPDLGYTFTSPLIVRMHNGKWAAVFGNGYNALEADGHVSTTGRGYIYIVDLETGVLISKLASNAGTAANPNGINAPTAVDLDNDNIVDIIYAGDLLGRLTKYDVSSKNPANWSRIGDQMFSTLDRADNFDSGSPITTKIAVGSHPTGEGLMVYMASGKYLEPSDQINTNALNRIYALWDDDPFNASDLENHFNSNRLLEQSITLETSVSLDTDGDGIDDETAEIRRSSQHEIDWDTQYGWYMNLEYLNPQGEQVIAAPLLREGRVIFSTHIPQGDECTPDQSGWLMVLDAASGAMPATAIDLNGDGEFSSNEMASGINGLGNPFSSPKILTSVPEDTILTNNPDGSGASSSSLDSNGLKGRVNWREVEP